MTTGAPGTLTRQNFSALQRAEIAEIRKPMSFIGALFAISVLFNEPKLLKFHATPPAPLSLTDFSALQRAEIAEIDVIDGRGQRVGNFSALQRAEIAEISDIIRLLKVYANFSALQRAEIAEISRN